MSELPIPQVGGLKQGKFLAIPRSLFIPLKEEAWNPFFRSDVIVRSLFQLLRNNSSSQNLEMSLFTLVLEF
ncbi:MAG: hypothetical protein QNJ64_01735 [Crocosphaera sp.]|nr:hypothetical protein [Crocosphaera sp.]